MGSILSYVQSSNQFSISYPYYGLFGTADVKPLPSEGDPLFECKLVNGAIILLKKIGNTRQWIDAQLNKQTPLSSVIGMYIDDVIKES
jgi:hypothetical protein